MTFPAKPKTVYDYVTFQTNNPTDPLPANQVAGDFASHKTSIDALVDFSKLVQRSDGRLNNGSVRPETLSAGTVALIGKWTPRGNWLTATAYAASDLVTESNNLYVCIVAHTSGTFATDLAAGDWQLIDGDTARIGADQTFTGVNTFSGAVNFDGAADFDGAVDMTGGTPTVPTKAAGTNTTDAASCAFVQAAVGKVKVQVFTATGTYTPGAGMVNCIIECWGGGGGGGGAVASTTGNNAGSGGGGGAGSYSRKLATAAQIGASKAVTIGAAGAAGTAGNNAGGAGGDTSVGSLCIGKGGSGGGGQAGTSVAVAAGGLGGVAGTGDITSTGMPGTGSVTFTNFILTMGGSSSVGGGGLTPVNGGGAAGIAGTGRGSGGSGGLGVNGGSNVAGGAGTAGYVVITEFCNQ